MGERAGVTLVVLYGSSPRSIRLPERGELLVGRGAECDIQIGDPKLSRQHAQVRVSPERVEIVDLGSRNGTFIGGKRLPSDVARVFGEGDVVTLGAAALVLKGEVDSVEASSHSADLQDAAGIVRVGAMRRLAPTIDKLAAGAINVLLLGETGVGKEILAHTFHLRSPRTAAPILSINCAAISDTLLEGELFGYERGAFTGAVQTKAGLLESADGGTVFLDEIGEMPLSLQAKLLRVLESGEVMRIGALKPRKIDVRFVSATNRNLEDDVETGRFRRDLYFRLAGATMELPPLRERTDEVEPLTRAFIASASSKLEKPVPDIEAAALGFLLHYAWPGNIRELKNVIDRAVLLCSGPRITLAHLPCERMARRTNVPVTIRETEGDAEPAAAPGAVTAPPPLDEKARIIAALDECVGNQTRAAKRLGIGRRTLIARMDKYGLPRPRK